MSLIGINNIKVLTFSLFGVSSNKAALTGLFNLISTFSPDTWLTISFKYSELYPIVISSPLNSPVICSFALEDFSGSSVVTKLLSVFKKRATWWVDLLEKIATLRIAPSKTFLIDKKVFYGSKSIQLIFYNNLFLRSFLFILNSFLNIDII